MSEYEDTVKVEVCDSIMGSGKSTYVIETMAKSVAGPLIIIVEQRSEVDRYVKIEGFHTPVSSNGGTLTESFKQLLNIEANIVTTHRLFEMWDGEIMRLIEWNDYSLIMDEVCTNIFDHVQVEAKDIQGCVDDGYVVVDDSSSIKALLPTGKPFYGRYKDLEKALDTRDVYTLESGDNEFFALLSAPKLELINSFKKITILTYLFEGSLLSAYLNLHGVPYEKFSVKDGTRCSFRDELGKKTADLITIHGNGLNFVKESECSKFWMKIKDNKKKVTNAVRSFMRHSGVSKDFFAWSCPKDYRDDMSHSEFHNKKLQLRIERGDEVSNYGQTFLPQNIRGVNHFSHKTHMAYTINVHINPRVKMFLVSNDVDFDHDQYALSQMIQWLWRGCIRNDEPMTVFIPPKRMRLLLEDWLGVDQVGAVEAA